MNENIKDTLNRAIDSGDIALADELAAQLVPGDLPAMPKNFVERIQAMSATTSGSEPVLMKKKFRNLRQRPVILAAALVLLMACGAVAYAAGLLFPSVKFKDGTATNVNAALESNEYKAASEYASYLNSQHKNLQSTVFDPIDYPIYADCAKVKELSQEYHLKYATERTDINSLEQVKQLVKDSNIPDFLGTALYGAKAGKAILGDGQTAFTFNDGNFYLAYILPSVSNNVGDSQVYVSYTPKGSFPWNGFCLSPGEGTDFLNQEKTFTYKTQNNLEFLCVPEMPKEKSGQVSGYTCFANIDGDYVTVSLYKARSKSNEKKYEQECKEIDIKYEQKAEKILGIDLETLNDRVYGWHEAAYDQDPKTMEKASLASTDPKEVEKLYADMEAKYSTATDKEKKLCTEWEEAGSACAEKYDYAPVDHDDLASVLEKFSL